MQTFTPLPTANKEWGFWGTCVQSGYDAEKAWDATSTFFAKQFDLTPEETRDLLDARFGRHLADDLSFIVGCINARSITNHLTRRIADEGWRKSFEKSIREVLGKTYPRKKPVSKEDLFLSIAREHLNIETLEERNSDSLDFHDVGVVGVRRALQAAFEAGKRARKGA